MMRAQAQAMAEAGKELSAAQAELPDLDDIQEQQFELNDMLAGAEEFNAALSQGFDVNAVSEADLAAELAGLDAELASIPTAPVYLPPGGQGQMYPQQQQPADWAAGGAVPSAPQAQPWLQQPTHVPAAAGPYATGLSSVRMP